MLKITDKGGRGIKQMLTKGGEGRVVRQTLTITDKGDKLHVHYLNV